MTQQNLIAIGASTGGTDAILTVLSGLGADPPPIAIVQHMPAAYTGAFARRLNDLCPIEVREARDHDQMKPGLALLAPGDRHLEAVRYGTGYTVRLDAGGLVSRHMPSVDVLFHSVAKAAGQMGIGVILTGMGSDGANGLRMMRDAGAQTFGQDAESCVVYGMPKAAMRNGSVQTEAPLQKLSDLILGASGAGGANAGKAASR